MQGDRMSNLGQGLTAVDWGSVQKVKGEWSYYQGNRISRSQEEIASWLRDNSVIIVGDRVPAPMLSFAELTAPEGIHRSFAEQRFSAPTPIQAMSWPILLGSRDLVGIAKTGSGKTLAFIVPAILHIAAQPPLQLGDGPIALVLAPTRELAVQIEEEAVKVTKRLGNVSTVCIYGGVPKFTQMRALRAGVQICIGTPGRLIDMLQSRATNLLRVTYLVLDEADRMLDMGFEPQIRTICSQIRPDRQTLMFSATWPEEIRNLASSYQRDFIRIHVGSIELSANSDVKQHIMAVPEFEKRDRLIDILRGAGRTRALIFVKTKRNADMLYDTLMRAGYNAAVIHGDKEQAHRDRVLIKFRREDNCVLVATDVAARGLDIKDLDIVVNYDFPMSIEDYVHRIGRTGRAGKSGDAYSFLTSENAKQVRDLKQLLIKAKQPIPVDLEELELGGGGRSFSRYGGGGGGGGGGGYRGGAGGGGYNGGGGYGGGGYAPAAPAQYGGGYGHAPVPQQVYAPAPGPAVPPAPRSTEPSFKAHGESSRRRSRSRSRSGGRHRRRSPSRSRSPKRSRRD